MKRTLLISLFLLLVATWAFGQYGSTSQTPSSGSAQSSTAASDTGSSKTVKGCLSGSDGNYMLTDKSGNTYQLKGDTSQLSNHVGHEIQVKGTLSAASSSTPSGTTGNPSSQTAAGASSTAGAEQTLDVTSMKHISETCTAGAKSKSGSDKSPMSEKPPHQ